MTARWAIYALLALAAGAMAQSAPAEVAGLYTEQQAAAGAAVYAAQCAICHGASLEGTYEVPALKGKFVANWAQRPVGNLYAYLGRAMPQNAPGSLPPEDNAALIAYILKANGYAAGARPLPADYARLRTAVLPKP